MLCLYNIVYRPKLFLLFILLLVLSYPLLFLTVILINTNFSYVHYFSCSCSHIAISQYLLLGTCKPYPQTFIFSSHQFCFFYSQHFFPFLFFFSFLYCPLLWFTDHNGLASICFLSYFHLFPSSKTSCDMMKALSIFPVNPRARPFSVLQVRWPDDCPFVSQYIVYLCPGFIPQTVMLCIFLLPSTPPSLPLLNIFFRKYCGLYPIFFYFIYQIQLLRRGHWKRFKY